MSGWKEQHVHDILGCPMCLSLFAPSLLVRCSLVLTPIIVLEWTLITKAGTITGVESVIWTASHIIVNSRRLCPSPGLIAGLPLSSRGRRPNIKVYPDVRVWIKFRIDYFDLLIKLDLTPFRRPILKP